MRCDQTFINYELYEATLQTWRKAIKIDKYELKVPL